MAKKSFFYGKKTLSIMLAASMLCSMMASVTAMSVSAYDGYDVSEHTFGVIGGFNEWYGDVIMTDDDGDGIYTAVIDTAGSYEFKVRADSAWDMSWGEYEADYDRTQNSQTNLSVTVEEGDCITVFLDTTRVSDEALKNKDSYVNEEDFDFESDGYEYWPVYYEFGDQTNPNQAQFTVSGNLSENQKNMRKMSNNIYEVKYTALPAGSYDFKITSPSDETVSWGAYDSKKKTSKNTGDIQLDFAYDTDLTVRFYYNEDENLCAVGYSYVAEDGTVRTVYAGNPQNDPTETFTFDSLNVSMYVNGQKRVYTMQDSDGDGIYEVTIKNLPDSYYNIYICADNDYSKTWGSNDSGNTFGSYRYFSRYLANTNLIVRLNTNGDKNYWIPELNYYNEYGEECIEHFGINNINNKPYSITKMTIDSLRQQQLYLYGSMTDYDSYELKDEDQDRIYTVEVKDCPQNGYFYAYTDHHRWGGDEEYSDDIAYELPMSMDVTVFFDATSGNSQDWHLGYRFQDAAGKEHTVRFNNKTKTSQPNPENAADFEYDIIDSGLVGGKAARITEYKGTDEDVVVPAYLGGYPTILDNYAFSENKTIKSVSLPENMTEVPQCCFQNCSSLETVKMPGVLNIEYDAFYNCSSLTSVEMPSVMTIGYEAFSSCSALKSIVFPESLSVINSYSFEYCYALSDIQFSENISSVAANAFYETAWRDNLPEGLTYIGKTAYVYQGSMPSNTVLKFKEGTKSIQCSLSGRKGLVGVEMPDSVESIVYGVFEDCTNLKTVKLSENLKVLPSDLFEGCSSLKEINIPASVQRIKYDAFRDCTALESVQLQEGLLYIDECVFENCSSLKEINIPASVTEMYWSAFNDASALKNINIASENTVYYSENGLLYRKEEEEYWVYDDTTGEEYLEKEEYYSLVRCPEGKTGTVVLSGKTKYIDYNAFRNCKNITSLGLPASVEDISTSVWGDLSGLESVSVNEKNDYYTAVDGVLYNKQKTAIICYPKNREGAYVVPSTVTSINSYAFANCKKMTSVTIYKNVKSIGSYAFEGCTALETATLCNGLEELGSYAFQECTALKKVVIPNTVKYVGRYAFENCTALTSVTIREGVETIGDSAFQNTGLKKVVIPDSVTEIDSSSFANCSSLTSVTLGQNLKSIGSYAFSYVPIENIVIPDSVESISYGAFSNCTSLTSVTLGQNITYIGDEAFYYCTALESIVLPDSLQTIRYQTFYNCKALASVTLGKNVDYIGSYAFQNTAIESIVIPDSVKTISYEAFYNCQSLISVTLGQNVESIGDYAFRYTAIQSIFIPKSVKTIGSSAFDTNSLERIEVAKENTQYFSDDGILYRNPTVRESDEEEEYYDEEYYDSNSYQNQVSVMLCPRAKFGDVHIHAGTKGIWPGAFRNCKDITLIVFPDSFTEIQSDSSSMLYGMDSLQAVIIPESVQSISNYFRKGSYYDDGYYYNNSSYRFTIYGKEGSAAQEFADQYSTIDFEDMAEYQDLEWFSLYSSSVIGEGSSNDIFTVLNPVNPSVNKMQFSSSDDSIAAVQDGMLLGIKAGTATITAKASNGLTVSKKITVTEDIVFENTSYLSNEKVSAGKEVEVFAKTNLEDETGFTYAYQYRKADSKTWVTKAGYSAKTSVKIALPSEGEYIICVKIKDKDGIVREKYLKAEAVLPIVNTSTIADGPFYSTKYINLKLSAEKGFGNYSYQVSYQPKGEEYWIIVEDYYDEDYYYNNFNISPLEAGEYTIRITAIDSDGSKDEKLFEITVKQGLIISSNVNYYNIVLGKEVQADITAEGGTGEYTYTCAYRYDYDDEWIELPDNDSHTYRFTPEKIGEYQVKMTVTDSDGQFVEDERYIYVNNGLKSYVYLDDSELMLGDYTWINHESSGGTGQYTSKVYYKKSSDTDWILLNTNTGWSYTRFYPESAGIYEIQVVVEDEDGHSVSKTMELKVNKELENTTELTSGFVSLGQSIKINAKAEGGSGEYQYAYYYKKASDQNWLKKSDFTDKTSVEITPAKAAAYMIKVIVKDSEGKEVEKILNIDVAKKLSNTSTLSAATVGVGESVTVKASHENGAGEVQYAYYYKKTTDKNWLKKSGYTSETSVEITPAKAVEYQVKVVAKDQSGVTSEKILTFTAEQKLSVSAKLSSEKIVLGDKVKVTASAAGGTGNYTYSYEYKKAADTKWVKKAYSESASFEFAPAKATEYMVKVLAKDSSGNVSESILNFTVGANLSIGAKLEPEKVVLGDKVKITASAAGGAGNYTYSYEYKKAADTKWVKKAYSESASFEFTPAKATEYMVKVLAKDSAGTVSENTLKFTVAPKLSASAKLESETVKLGEKGKVTVSAAGGTGNYTYSYEYKKATDTKWLKKDYSETAYFEFTPAKATEYMIKVLVKDSAGTISENILTCNVIK